MSQITIRALLILTLISSVYAAEPELFQFKSEERPVQGYLVLPQGRPGALILYFHRAIEDRNAVKDWAQLVGPRNYAVAGYTATGSTDLAKEASSAIAVLKKRPDLSTIPVYVMGASMGSRAAAALFSADASIKGLILVVPAGEDVCAALSKSGGRPVLLIQAQNDDVVGPAMATKVHKCLPKDAGYYLVENAGHRFAASLISPKILEWLDAQRVKK